MNFKLQFVPDIFIPRWTTDDDLVYLIVQPLLAQGLAVDYLTKYFSVPSFAEPARPDLEVLLPVQTQQLINDETSLVPVPLADSLQVDVTWLNADGNPAQGVSQHSRRMRGFATMVSYDEHVRANRIYPRKFSIKSIEDPNTGQKIPYPYWWTKNEDSLPWQPDQYSGVATYAQILAHQLRMADKGVGTPTNQAVERLEQQLMLAFAVGRLFRVFRDAGQPLFSGFPNPLLQELMLVPNLLPGENWSDIDPQDFPRWHTNLHSLCGLVYPIGTKSQLSAMAADQLPEALRLKFSVPSGQPSQAHRVFTSADPDADSATIVFGNMGSNQPFANLFTDIKAGVAVQPGRVAVSRPAHLQDMNRLVFAINKTLPLSLEPQLAAAFDGCAYVYHAETQDDAESRAARRLPQFELLNSEDFESLTFVTDQQDPALTSVQLGIQITGHFEFYRGRRVMVPAAGENGGTIEGPQQLLQFVSDQLLPDAVIQRLKTSFEEPRADSIDLLALRSSDDEDGIAWSNVQQLCVHVDIEPSPPNQPIYYRPILFFGAAPDQPLDAERLGALLNRAVLTLRFGNPIEGQWQAKPVEDHTQPKARLHLWRSKPGQWANAAVQGFNTIWTPEVAQPSKTQPVLWYKHEFAFHFARSARHCWLPLQAEFDALPNLALTPDARGDLNEVVGVDRWMHKELNVYVRDSASAHPFVMMNPETAHLPSFDELVPAPADHSRLSRSYIYHNQAEPGDSVGENPYPPAAADYELSYPSWPEVPPRQEFSGVDFLGKQMELSVGFEHQYGTQIIGQAGGQAWRETFVPTIDWPFTDPTTIRSQLSGPMLRADRQDQTVSPDSYFLSYSIPKPPDTADHSTLKLRIMGSWLNEAPDQHPEPGTQPGDPVTAEREQALKQRAILTRKAAFDLLRASRIQLLVHGYQFDLQFGGNALDGTGHNRHFSEKLRPAFENAQHESFLRIQLDAIQRAQLESLLQYSDDGEILIELPSQLAPDKTGKVHEWASLVECELRVERDRTEIPDSQLEYWIVRPKLGLEQVTANRASLTISGEQLLDPACWGDVSDPTVCFEDVSQQTADKLETYINQSLVALQSYLMPTSERSERYRQRLNMLTTRSYAMAPDGFVTNAPARLRHAVVPLCFLPIAKHPAFFEATREVFLLLIRTLVAFNRLQLNEFDQYDNDTWRAFFKEGGELPLTALKTAMATTLVPIAAEGVQANLAGERADEWRQAVGQLAWPQQYVRKLLEQNLLVYEETKAMLAHVLAPAHNDFPPYFHSLIMSKDAKEEDLPTQTMSIDRDVFSYQASTFNVQHSNELLIGDILDDLTYDNEFEIEQVFYRTAEEFIESLEPQPLFTITQQVAEIVGELSGTADPLLGPHVGPAARAQFSLAGYALPADDLLGVDEDTLNEIWLINIEPNAYTPDRTYQLERIAGQLSVSLLEQGGHTLSLVDSGMELPFGPAQHPNDPNQQTLVGLIARESPARPLIHYQVTLPDVQFGDPQVQYLQDLEAISQGKLFVDGDDLRATYVKWGPTLTSDNWQDDVLKTVDLVIGTVLVAVQSDEEGQLVRDELLFRAASATVADRDPMPPLRSALTEQEVEQLRRQGPRAQTVQSIRKWLKAPTTPHPVGLEDWLVEMLKESLKLPEEEKDWSHGKVVFGKFEDFPCLEGDRIPQEPHVSATRVSLFRPLGDQPAKRATHLVAVESRLTAGEMFSSRGYRLTRNAERTLLKTEFKPDPRFVYLTRPAVRPSPILTSKVFDFAQCFPDKYIRLGRTAEQGMNLHELRAALEAAGARFRDPNSMLTGTIRVAVYRAHPNPAPRFTFATVAGGTVATHSSLTEDGHLHPVREAMKLFRFNEPGDASPAVKIHLPPLYERFLIDLECLSANGTVFLKVQNIPARSM